MPQQAAAIGPSTQALNDKLAELRTFANGLRLKASDLEVSKGQLYEQRRSMGADVSRTAINKQIADVEHELTATRLQIETMNTQIEDVQHERDMARAFSLEGPSGTTETAPQSPDPNLPLDQMVGAGAFLLLLPLVLAFARRIWRRSGMPAIDVENSPRLQRIEQAVESIAVEVERIGEAQRFTTKLLAERQTDAAPSISSKRREPGAITPH
jgi:hypothetical protein